MAFGSGTGVVLGGGGGSYTSSYNPGFQTVVARAPVVTVTYTPPVTVNATPVTPTFDPKIEANALYGRPMALFTGGYARIGGSPAPIVGPFITAGVVDFIVSFGVPSNVEGDRKIYKIYLDNELAWSSTSGGTLPAHGTFAAEAFDFIFKPGTLTQTVCSLETTHYPGDEIAYRPQMILQITGLPIARFMTNTGKPVPYVACDIGDVTDGANPLDFINLGEALERIAYSPWAGYTTDTFEAVNVSDIVDAILIKDNFTIVQVCQSVTREYRNLDLVQSDKLRIKDRGSSVAPDFIFDRDSIISGDSPLVVTRAGATAQKREHELISIDPDQDYTMVPSLAQIPRNPFVISAAVGKETVTTPLVIDASTRQALATFSQNYEENARRTIALKTRAIGYEIEPGDLFAVTDIADGFDNEVFKVTSTTHGANFVVDLEGEAILRCRIYSPTVTGPSVIQPVAPTQVHGGGTNFVGFAASAGNLVILLLAGFRSITNARTLLGVTIDGHAATIHTQVVNNFGGAGPNLAIVSLVMPSAMAPGALIQATYDGLITSAFMSPYILTSYLSATPHDVDAIAVVSGNPSVAIDIPDGGVAFALWVGSGGTPAGCTFTGVAVEDYDSPGLALGGSIQVAAGHESALTIQTGRAISGSSTMTAESIIAASWS